MPLSASAFWESIQPAVTQAFETALPAVDYFDQGKVIIKEDASDTNLSELDNEKRLQRMWRSEEAFITTVWSRLGQLLMQEHVVILFDIDQTLGSIKQSEAGEKGTVLRPSAIPLIEGLRAEGMQTGIITARYINDVQLQLKDQRQLAQLKGLIDEDHITGGDMLIESVLEAQTGSKHISQATFELFSHLLVPPYSEFPQFQGYQDEKGEELPAKDVNKLLQLAESSEKFSHKMFVVIDDREYASILPDPGSLRLDGDRVGAIHLRPNERAHY